jgi:hypothetical protein
VRITGQASTPAGKGPASIPLTARGMSARGLVALLDALPIVQPSLPEACPAIVITESVTLRVIGAGGRSLARAVESPFGCAADVAFQVAGRRGPALQDGTAPPDGLSTVSDELIAAHVIARCDAASLRPSAATPQRRNAATPQRTSVGGDILLAVTERHRRPCYVSGYANVQLLSARGQAIRSTQHDQDPGQQRREGTAADVLLFPHETAVSEIGYRTCKSTQSATTVRLRLPDTTALSSLTLSPHTIRACPGGTLTIEPLTVGYLPASR